LLPAMYEQVPVAYVLPRELQEQCHHSPTQLTMFFKDFLRPQGADI